MPAFTNRSPWYFGLSAYWFATSYKWFILLLAVLPGQVEKVVPGGEKSAYWGTIFAIGAAWATIGPAVFGYLSDYLTRGGQHPERRLFLALGSGLTVIALFTLMKADTLALITVGYLLLQVSDDIGTGPYSAAIPELVPEEFRGRAGGVMGLLTAAGQVTSALVGMVLGKIELIYIGIAVVNVLCVLWTIQTLKGAVPSRASPAPKQRPSFGSFVKGWLEPWKSRDFFWVWFTRFLNAFGFYLIQPYLKYYIDARVADASHKVHLASFTFDAGFGTNLLGLIISAMAILGSIYASKAADRIGRKKVIYVAGSLMSAGLIPFALIPNYTVIFGIAIVFGIGYGMYLSADWALAADVMPDADTLAKDMGVWQMSNSAVQVFSGLVGWVIWTGNSQIAAGAGYTIAFLAAAVAFFMSTILVRKVQGST